MNRAPSRYSLALIYCCEIWSICTSAFPYKPEDVIATEWKEAYSEIFGNDSDRMLARHQVMERVTFMYEEMDEIDNDVSITTEQKGIVAYWHGVLTDIDTDHCNTAHLDDILKHLKQLRHPPSTNQATLFWLVHQNLIYICDDLHLGIRDEMRRIFDFESYSKLLSISYRFELWLEDLTTARWLSKELFELLNVDKTLSKSKIVKAWDEGPCKQVKTVLESTPQFRSFHEFAKLNSVAGLESVRQCPSSTYLWVRIVFACDELGRVMPELANENKALAVANRHIKSYYKGVKSSVANAFDKMMPHG